MTSALPDSEVAAILAIAKAATAGPWKHYAGKLRPQFPTPINEVQARNKAVVFWSGFDASGFQDDNAANAAFIAAARSDVPALARELMAVRAALREYMAAYPAFRVRPVGAPTSPARERQEQEIAREDRARAALPPESPDA